MVDVSVVIPIYNGMQFINHLLEMLQAQTYQAVEFILVDDGSTDGTREFLQSVQNSLDDSRFKFFFKPNSGVSNTRNYGLKQVQGEYVMFTDVDDHLLPNMVEKYVETIKKNKTDFVFFATEKVNLLGDKLGKIGYTDDQCDVIYTRNELVSFIGQQRLQGYLFLLISKASLWTADTFNPKFKVQEDLAAIAKIISQNSQITATFKNEIYYLYVQHENSAMNSLQVEQFPVFVEVADEIVNYFDKDVSVQVMKELNGLRISSLMNVLAVAALSNNKKLANQYREKFLNEFKKTDFPNIKVRLRKKIQYFAVKFNIKFIITFAYRKIFKV